MSSVCIPANSRGLLAAHESRIIFAPKPKKNADVGKLLSAQKDKELGEDGVIMDFDAIKSIAVHHDDAGTTVIDGKGLSIILAKIPNEDDRQKIINAITGARPFVHSQKKSGIIATARYPFLFFIISIIMTFCGVMASISANGGEVDSGNRSGRRGAQQDAFAALITALGTGGTAVIGGLFILGSGAWLANRLKHHRYQIDLYRPE